jgi:hypothetical protein
LPSNTTLNTGTGGDVITTKERTHDGDATKQQMVGVSGVSGSEGSYTFVDVQAGGGVEASALRVTIASDSTGVLSIDDNGGNISIDDGGNTITVDGTVTANLAAGTNNIGDVDILSIAAGDNNIGNVDIASAIPAGANLIGSVTAVGAAAEDAAASGNPVLVGGRYDSTPRTLETGDAGAVALNASGHVLVEISAGAGSGGTSAADDADFTDGTTSGTPIMGVYESTPSTVTDGDMGIVGITESRALKVSIASGGIAGIVDDAAFTPATSEVLPVGFTFDNAATDSVDEGDIGAARMSANRNIFVNIRDNAGNERGLNIDASGQLAANVAMMNGVAVTMGNGGVGTGVQRVTLANDSTGVLATVSTVTTVTNITNQGHGADDAAFTPATTRVMMSGYFADETATDSVDEGDMGAARITLDRKQITTPYVHAAAGGQSIFRSIDLDETEEEVKGSAGKLFWISAINVNASLRYLKIYNNTAAGTTVGTTTPVMTFPIPASATGAGFTISFGDTGVGFSTGITVAATTGAADADTGAPGANEVFFNCGYV